MLNVKYFAYGSNINIARLKDRLEFYNEPVKPGIPYILENYRLSFNAGGSYSVFANIIPSVGDRVEGILYDLTPSQFKRLDGYEAFYEKYYFQIDNNTIGCAYIATANNTSNKESKPDLYYLNIIIDGCKESGLTNTYAKLLDFKLKNYKIKKSKHKWQSILA